MQHASTTQSKSHAKSDGKARRERVRYWVNQGLSLEEAEREADAPTRRRRRLRVIPSNTESKQHKAVVTYAGTKPTLPACNSANLCEPAANLEPAATCNSANLCEPATNLEPAAACNSANLCEPAANLEPANCQEVTPPSIAKVSFGPQPELVSVREPTPDQIRAEVELQKRLGKMIEIPAAGTKASNSILAQAHPDEAGTGSNLRRLPLDDKGEPEQSTNEGHDYAKIALVSVAVGCSTVLVHTLAEALGGGFWNHLIAAGFEYTPIALMIAKIRDGKTREKAAWGGILLFMASLGLFIGPQVTTLLNELSIHQAQSAAYAIDLRKYENSQSLVERAKTRSEAKDASHKQITESEGENSTKATQAKREADKAFAEWKKASKDAEAALRPSAPRYSEDFVAAMQSIVMRIGLFMAAFLSAYVVRRME